MRYIISIMLLLITINANEIEEGHKLYKEANCAKCHLDGNKFDPNSIKKPGLSFKSKSFKDVKQWVINCDDYFSVGWFDDEQEKVAKYVNSIFYKFKE